MTAANKEVTNLRRRAEAVWCRVRVFQRKDYRFEGKPVRYSIVNDHQERFASDIIELRDLVQQEEDRATLRRRRAFSE
jgi:hypothetical protein